VREEVLNLLGHNMDSGESGGSGGGERTANKGKSKTPALDSFGRDLTELARQGKLDPDRPAERNRTCHSGAESSHKNNRYSWAKRASARRPLSRDWHS